jgi:hypothetical protein
MESLFEGSTEPVVGIKPHFGGNLVDRVIRFFQELFGLLETKLKSVLVRAGLKELPEALLQFELIDTCPIGEDGDVNMVNRVFFDEGLGQFDSRNVVELGTLYGMSVAADSFLAHGDKV